MKHTGYVVAIALLSCIGCSNAGTPISEFTNSEPSVKKTHDSGMPETSTDDSSVNVEVDSGLAPPYVACVSDKFEPTSYPRLTVRYCTDSTGNTYLESYHDDVLNIACNWDTGTDNMTRCLPNDWQTPPMYTDDSCSTAIVFLPDGPLPRYMGIMWSLVSGQNELIIYQLGNVWVPTDMGLTYEMQTNPSGSFECEASVLPLRSIQFVELGSTVSPSIFQLQ